MCWISYFNNWVQYTALASSCASRYRGKKTKFEILIKTPLGSTLPMFNPCWMTIYAPTIDWPRSLLFLGHRLIRLNDGVSIHSTYYRVRRLSHLDAMIPRAYNHPIKYLTCNEACSEWLAEQIRFDPSN